MSSSGLMRNLTLNCNNVGIVGTEKKSLTSKFYENYPAKLKTGCNAVMEMFYFTKHAKLSIQTKGCRWYFFLPGKGLKTFSVPY